MSTKITISIVPIFFLLYYYLTPYFCSRQGCLVIEEIRNPIIGSIRECQWQWDRWQQYNLTVSGKWKSIFPQLKKLLAAAILRFAWRLVSFLNSVWADIFIVIGTSLNVYPAAGLVYYIKPGTPVYLIDPKTEMLSGVKNLTVYCETAGTGVPKLVNQLLGKDNNSPETSLKA